MTALNSAAITAAYGLIDPVFLHSPQFELDSVNEALGSSLVLKLETLNPIRSFKGRGTSLLVAQADASKPIVCASAGNFGQGMAYACTRAGISLTVYAATTANTLKLERMASLGATVVLEGRDFDAAKEAARSYAQQHAYRFVEDSADLETALGAGTIGLELSNYPAFFDTVIVPLGNGALINGIGTWFKAHSPQTTVLGVVASAAPAMDLSWRAGKIVTTPTADTIADGIGVRLPVPVALEQMKDTVDTIVQVSDDDILAAIRFAHQYIGVVLEPAGAAGLAAALTFNAQFKGQTLATVLCGSNLTSEQLEAWL